MRYERVVMLAVVGTLGVWAVTCKSDNGGGPPSGGTPSVDVGADLSIQPSQTVSFTGRIALPNGANASDYHWTLTWGDGTTDTGTLGSDGFVTAAHSYGSVGEYPLHLAAQGPNAADTASDTSRVFVDAPGTPQVFIGAGDVAECGKPGNWPVKTAQLIDTTARSTVFTLGDNAYPYGRAEDYNNCYDPTWGRFRKRTHPTAGNHEYQENVPVMRKDSTGDGYFGYFGVAAGQQPRGWYSYNLGAWHVIVLNSNFLESEALGRAIPLQAQLAWLSSDLAAHPATCTIAMWHHPHFSSGTTHGNKPSETQPTKPFWDTLYAHGADVILAGHEHNYERFAPQTPDGAADPATGIREFVVGTGGGGYDSLDVTKVGQLGNSEVGSVDHGVLKLTLLPGSYQWEFIPVGYTLPVDATPPQYSHTDSGSGSCH